MSFRFWVLFLLFPSIAFSYTVVRKDGKQFSGELIQQTEQVVIIKDEEGVTVKFSKDQIDWEKTTAALRKEESQKKRIAPALRPEETITLEFQKRKRAQWSGEPISVDFKEVDIRDFFRFIADTAGINLILDPAVKGTLTLKMTDVPWDQILDVVCRTYGYGYEIDGNFMNIDR